MLRIYIKNIHLYRRTRLPDKCVCGNLVFSDRDSMSFVIECN